MQFQNANIAGWLHAYNAVKVHRMLFYTSIVKKYCKHIHSEQLNNQISPNSASIYTDDAHVWQIFCYKDSFWPKNAPAVKRYPWYTHINQHITYHLYNIPIISSEPIIMSPIFTTQFYWCYCRNINRKIDQNAPKRYANQNLRLSSQQQLFWLSCIMFRCLLST